MDFSRVLIGCSEGGFAKTNGLARRAPIAGSHTSSPSHLRTWKPQQSRGQLLSLVLRFVFLDPSREKLPETMDLSTWA